MITEDLIVRIQDLLPSFKQGNLQTADFSIDENYPRTVELDINNIDNNDVWLYPN